MEFVLTCKKYGGGIGLISVIFKNSLLRTYVILDALASIALLVTTY